MQHDCWIIEKQQSRLLNSFVQPAGAGAPRGAQTIQEDTEALTSRVGEEISEVCPWSAPRELQKKFLASQFTGRGFNQPTLVVSCIY